MSARLLKGALLALATAAFAYLLLGAPPGYLGPSFMLSNSYSKLISCLIVGVLVALADCGIEMIDL